jgi:hypothetical protein
MEILTLKFLSVASDKVAKEILKTVSPPIIRRLSEVAYNCLFTDLRLSKSQSKRIHRHRKQLLKLADKRTPLQDKRRILRHLPVPYLQFILKIDLPLIPNG